MDIGYGEGFVWVSEDIPDEVVKIRTENDLIVSHTVKNKNTGFTANYLLGKDIFYNTYINVSEKDKELTLSEYKLLYPINTVWKNNTDNEYVTITEVFKDCGSIWVGLVSIKKQMQYAEYAKDFGKDYTESKYIPKHETKFFVSATASNGVQVCKGDLWLTIEDEPIMCEVVSIYEEGGVVWVDSYSGVDGLTDDSPLDDFVKHYEILESFSDCMGTDCPESKGKEQELLDVWSKGWSEGFADTKYCEQKLGSKAGDKKERKHSHYFKNVEYFDEMDTYLFCRVWKVKDDSGALHHALKKLMDAGKRGNKDKLKDISEARDTLNRYIEIEEMMSKIEGGENESP